MIYSIYHEPEAREALKDILFYYIDTVGYEVALDISFRIETSINSLANMPKKCQVSDFSKNVRKLSIPNLPYIVYFTIEGNQVIILEVIHGSRNQTFLLEKYKNY